LAVIRGSLKELDLLLRNHSEQIDINRYDCDGRTPLQEFCGRGSLDLVKLMVQYGADTRRRTREGWALVHMASFCGNPEMLGYVLRCNRR
jgi:ankyrin repeat protein